MRMQQNPDSLVHRVLKAKYFPNSVASEAELGSRPSYAWRSIWTAKKWLIGGLDGALEMGKGFGFGRIGGFRPQNYSQ